MASANSLVVNLTAKTSAFERGIARAQRRLTSFAKFAKRTIGNIAKSLLTPTGILGTLGVGAGGAAVLKMAADAETLQIQLEVLTGSARSASELLQKMQALAIESPFDRQQLIEGTKTMIAFGVETEKAAQFMEYLSQIAAGDEQRLQSLTLAFSQSAAAGRLMGQDVLQMVNAGFNPMLEISRKTGESMLQLKKRMESGRIAFSEVADAFKSATEEGGRFFGMNQRMAETTTGKWMKFVEGVKMLARGIGSSLLPFANAMLDSVIPAIQRAGVEMEQFAAGFKQMPDKAAFLKDVLVSAFDVATETILAKWRTTIASMRRDWNEGMRGLGMGMLRPRQAIAEERAREVAGMQVQNDAPLNAAVARFNALIEQAKGPAPAVPQGAAAGFAGMFNFAMQNLPPNPVAKGVSSGLQSLLERLKVKGNVISWGFRGILDRAKIRGGAFMNMLENWFGGGVEAETPQRRENRTAAAMERGSAEAYSAIVQAMLGSTDPTVGAIQKMQAAVVGQLKKNAEKAGPKVEIVGNLQGAG